MTDLKAQHRTRVAAELGLAGNHPDAITRHLDNYEALIRATALHDAADAIERETQALKDAGVLEPDKYRPCRDAAAQLRKQANEIAEAATT